MFVSDDFARKQQPPGKTKRMTTTVNTIDVKRLIAETSLEDLNRLAEDYFAQVDDWNFHLAKPFGSVEEAPQLLINFAVILQGLNICPGMTVLEFGAGSCWASRYLTQLGCRVIAADVSPTALKIGRELYQRQPVIGNKPEPEFLLFDGQHLDVPDESVDRILCLDALHHVPNTQDVLREMGRVLCRGGIAGFGEPGPTHSTSEKSQREMRDFGVVENDVNIREIWAHALNAGFTDIKLAVFNVPAFHLSLADFENFVAERTETDPDEQRTESWERYATAVRDFLANQRTFFLYKGMFRMSDSRYRAGLKARIEIREAAVTARANETIVIHASVTNDSPSIWLPRGAGLGAVLLGVHVCNREGHIIKNSYYWEALTPDKGRPILSGEAVDVEVNIPGLRAGSYLLKFDMVSYDVCWFAANGSPEAVIALEVF
jgi:ubiquinone/menaquinone biosynthesis C-methylase UbiE